MADSLMSGFAPQQSEGYIPIKSDPVSQVAPWVSYASQGLAFGTKGMARGYLSSLQSVTKGAPFEPLLSQAGSWLDKSMAEGYGHEGSMLDFGEHPIKKTIFNVSASAPLMAGAFMAQRLAGNNPLAAGVVIFPQSQGDFYKQAKDNGLPDNEAMKLSVLNGLFEAGTEVALPYREVGNILKSGSATRSIFDVVNKGSLPALAKSYGKGAALRYASAMGKVGAEEGFEEILQNTFSGALRKYGWNDDDIFQGVGEGAIAGLVSGALLGGAAQHTVERANKAHVDMMVEKNIKTRFPDATKEEIDAYSQKAYEVISGMQKQLNEKDLGDIVDEGGFATKYAYLQPGDGKTTPTIQSVLENLGTDEVREKANIDADKAIKKKFDKTFREKDLMEDDVVEESPDKSGDDKESLKYVPDTVRRIIAQQAKHFRMAGMDDARVEEGLLDFIDSEIKKENKLYVGGATGRVYSKKSKAWNPVHGLKPLEEAIDLMKNPYANDNKPKGSVEANNIYYYMAVPTDEKGVDMSNHHIDTLAQVHKIASEEYSRNPRQVMRMVDGDLIAVDSDGNAVGMPGAAAFLDSINGQHVLTALHYLKPHKTAGLAEILKDYIKRNKIVVTVEVHDKPNNDDATVEGKFTQLGRRSGKIDIYKPAFATDMTTKRVARVLLHESVHAVTSNLIDNYAKREGNTPEQDKLISELHGLYADVTAKVSDAERSHYGFSDLHEFVSAGLTDPEFQKILNIHPYDTQKSIGARFKDILIKLFNSIAEFAGIKINTRSSLQALIEAFSDLSTLDEVDTDGAQRRVDSKVHYSKAQYFEGTQGIPHISVGLPEARDVKTKGLIGERYDPTLYGKPALHVPLNTVPLPESAANIIANGGVSVVSLFREDTAMKYEGSIFALKDRVIPVKVGKKTINVFVNNVIKVTRGMLEEAKAISPFLDVSKDPKGLLTVKEKLFASKTKDGKVWKDWSKSFSNNAPWGFVYEGIGYRNLGQFVRDGVPGDLQKAFDAMVEQNPVLQALIILTGKNDLVLSMGSTGEKLSEDDIMWMDNINRYKRTKPINEKHFNGLISAKHGAAQTLSYLFKTYDIKGIKRFWSILGVNVREKGEDKRWSITKGANLLHDPGYKGAFSYDNLAYILELQRDVPTRTPVPMLSRANHGPDIVPMEEEVAAQKRLVKALNSSIKLKGDIKKYNDMSEAEKQAFMAKLNQEQDRKLVADEMMRVAMGANNAASIVRQFVEKYNASVPPGEKRLEYYDVVNPVLEKGIMSAMAKLNHAIAMRRMGTNVEDELSKARHELEDALRSFSSQVSQNRKKVGDKVIEADKPLESTMEGIEKDESSAEDNAKQEEGDEDNDDDEVSNEEADTFIDEFKKVDNSDIEEVNDEGLEGEIAYPQKSKTREAEFQEGTGERGTMASDPVSNFARTITDFYRSASDIIDTIATRKASRLALHTIVLFEGKPAFTYQTLEEGAEKQFKFLEKRGIDVAEFNRRASARSYVRVDRGALSPASGWKPSNISVSHRMAYLEAAENIKQLSKKDPILTIMRSIDGLGEARNLGDLESNDVASIMWLYENYKKIASEFDEAVGGESALSNMIKELPPEAFQSREVMSLELEKRMTVYETRQIRKRDKAVKLANILNTKFMLRLGSPIVIESASESQASSEVIDLVSKREYLRSGLDDLNKELFESDKKGLSVDQEKVKLLDKYREDLLRIEESINAVSSDIDTPDRAKQIIETSTELNKKISKMKEPVEKLLEKLKDPTLKKFDRMKKEAELRSYKKLVDTWQSQIDSLRPVKYSIGASEAIEIPAGSYWITVSRADKDVKYLLNAENKTPIELNPYQVANLISQAPDAFINSEGYRTDVKSGGKIRIHYSKVPNVTSNNVERTAHGMVASFLNAPSFQSAYSWMKEFNGSPAPKYKDAGTLSGELGAIAVNRKGTMEMLSSVATRSLQKVVDYNKQFVDKYARALWDNGVKDGLTFRSFALKIDGAISEIMTNAAEEIHTRGFRNGKASVATTEIGLATPIDYNEGKILYKTALRLSQTLNMPFNPDPSTIAQDQNGQWYFTTRPRRFFWTMLGTVDPQFQKVLTYTKGELEYPLLVAGVKEGIFNSFNMADRIINGYIRRAFDNPLDRERKGGGAPAQGGKSAHVAKRRSEARTYDQWREETIQQGLAPTVDFMGTMRDYLVNYSNIVIQHHFLQTIKNIPIPATDAHIFTQMLQAVSDAEGSGNKSPMIPGTGLLDAVANLKIIEYQSSETVKYIASILGLEPSKVLTVIQFSQAKEYPGFSKFWRGEFQKPFLHMPLARMFDTVFVHGDASDGFGRIATDVVSTYKRYMSVNPFDSPFLFMSGVLMNSSPSEYPSLIADYFKTIGKGAKESFADFGRMARMQDLETVKDFNPISTLSPDDTRIFMHLTANGFTGSNVGDALAAAYDKSLLSEFDGKKTMSSQAQEYFQSALGINNVLFRGYINPKILHIAIKKTKHYMSLGMNINDASRRAAEFMNTTSGLLNHALFGAEGKWLSYLWFARGLTTSFLRMASIAAYPILPKGTHDMSTQGMAKYANAFKGANLSESDIDFLSKEYIKHLGKMFTVMALSLSALQYILSYFDDDKRDEHGEMAKGNPLSKKRFMILNEPGKRFSIRTPWKNFSQQRQYLDFQLLREAKWIADMTGNFFSESPFEGSMKILVNRLNPINQAWLGILTGVDYGKGDKIFDNDLPLEYKADAMAKYLIEKLIPMGLSGVQPLQNKNADTFFQIAGRLGMGPKFGRPMGEGVTYDKYNKARKLIARKDYQDDALYEKTKTMNTVDAIKEYRKTPGMTGQRIKNLIKRRGKYTAGRDVVKRGSKLE